MDKINDASEVVVLSIHKFSAFFRDAQQWLVEVFRNEHLLRPADAYVICKVDDHKIGFTDQKAVASEDHLRVERHGLPRSRVYIHYLRFAVLAQILAELVAPEARAHARVRVDFSCYIGFDCLHSIFSFISGVISFLMITPFLFAMPVENLTLRSEETKCSDA